MFEFVKTDCDKCHTRGPIYHMFSSPFYVTFGLEKPQVKQKK